MSETLTKETLAKIEKKRHCPLEVNGETIYVRDPTRRERRRGAAVTPEENKPAFFIGCVLYSGDSYDMAFPQLPDEDDNTWAQRVSDALDETCDEMIATIINGVTNLGKIPKVADIVKN